MELMKNDEKMMKNDKQMKMKKMEKNEKQTRGKLQFSKKWKIAIFPQFFSFFFHFFIMFHHFCFQCSKNFPKNKKNAIFLEFFFIFLSFFYHFLSFFLTFLLPVVGGIDEKWWKMMKMIKNDKKMKKTRGKLQFSIFCFFFAPLEEKMLKKW